MGVDPLGVPVPVGDVVSYEKGRRPCSSIGYKKPFAIGP